MHCQNLTYTQQLQPNIIISIKRQKKGKDVDEVKIIKNIYDYNIEYTDQTWERIDRLLKKDVTIIGERKWFLKLIPYKFYYKK
jgi:hypothetical protein